MPMRALIVTNMSPSPAKPALGSFVRDQVEALKRIPEVEIELFAFDPGSPGAYRPFPADPGRQEKRYDRATEVAAGAELLVLRNVDPAEVPLWVNAASAVLVTSEREGFGLGALEALACDVPVLSTDVGIAP